MATAGETAPVAGPGEGTPSIVMAFGCLIAELSRWISAPRPRICRGRASSRVPATLAPITKSMRRAASWIVTKALDRVLVPLDSAARLCRHHALTVPRLERLGENAPR